MRLFISSCLIALFSLSAQAGQKITIEGEFKAPGSKTHISVFSALNATLEVQGYSCKLVYGLLELPCTVSYTDKDSLTDTRTRIQMNWLHFNVLSQAAAQNREINKRDRNQFKKNIRDFNRNNDTMQTQDPVDFYLYEENRPRSFNSYNYSNFSRVRVTQH